MRTIRTIATVFLLSLMFAVAGCEEKGTAEKAGERIDEAAEKAGEEIEKAGDEIEEAAEEAEEEMDGDGG